MANNLPGLMQQLVRTASQPACSSLHTTHCQHCWTDLSPLLLGQPAPQPSCLEAQQRKKREAKKRKERTTPFSVYLMRSQVSYQAAQGTATKAQKHILPHATMGPCKADRSACHAGTVSMAVLVMQHTMNPWLATRAFCAVEHSRRRSE